jgi:hypothetical protein
MLYALPIIPREYETRCYDAAGIDPVDVAMAELELSEASLLAEIQNEDPDSRDVANVSYDFDEVSR